MSRTRGAYFQKKYLKTSKWGPIKIVADLCDLSKPVREGHSFNGKRIRSIGLTGFEKNKKDYQKFSQNADFSVLSTIIVGALGREKKIPPRLGP